MHYSSLRMLSARSSETEKEDQSLLSLNAVISYPSVNDDHFTFKVNQQPKITKVGLGEHSGAYSVLKHHNLLITAFRKEFFDDIFMDGDLTPNSSISKNFAKKWNWGKA